MEWGTRGRGDDKNGESMKCKKPMVIMMIVDNNG